MTEPVTTRAQRARKRAARVGPAEPTSDPAEPSLAGYVPVATAMAAAPADVTGVGAGTTIPPIDRIRRPRPVGPGSPARKTRATKTAPKSDKIQPKKTQASKSKVTTSTPAASRPAGWGDPERLHQPPRPNPDGSMPASIFSYSNRDRVTTPDLSAGQPADHRHGDEVDQVKYGPGEGMREGSGTHKRASADQLAVLGLLTGSPTVPGGQADVHEKRLTAYATQHSTYVQEAISTGRPLTEQEAAAQATGENAKQASINHVIASGVGQNMLNQGIAQSLRGQQKIAQARASGATPRELVPGLADQAAAIGRQQIYSRAILAERATAPGQQPNPDRPLVDPADAGSRVRAGSEQAPQPDAVEQARNTALMQTIQLMGGAARAPDDHMATYHRLLQSTFDSPGNLRVGDATLNTRISTGFDAELDSAGRPTPRTERLFEAHRAAKADHDDRVFTTFRGSGDRLASSRQVSPVAPDAGPVKASPRVAALWAATAAQPDAPPAAVRGAKRARPAGDAELEPPTKRHRPADDGPTNDEPTAAPASDAAPVDPMDIDEAGPDDPMDIDEFEPAPTGSTASWDASGAAADDPMDIDDDPMDIDEAVVPPRGNKRRRDDGAAGPDPDPRPRKRRRLD